jgi:hypothetical protein
MKRAIAIAMVLASAPAHAEEINFAALDAGDHQVHVRAGAEYGFVLGAGYAQTFSWRDRPVVIGGDLTMPFAEADGGDFAARASVTAPIIVAGPWHVIGSVAPTVRTTKNDIARMVSIDTDLELVAGRYTRRWFAAAELGFDAALATHVAHADAYRMTVYPDAVDGWYRTPGGNFRYGVDAGLSFGRYDVILRAGKLVDVAGNVPLLPIYGTLTLVTRW